MKTALFWRGWLVAVAIFVFGLAVGGMGAAWVGVRFLRHTLQSSTEAAGPADRAAARIGAQLTRSLELTPAESARMQALLDESAANLKAIRARAALQAGAELRATTRRIAAELPAEKQAEFYRVIAKRYQRLGLPPPRAEPPAAP